jgi:hypothetical protein
VKGIIDGVVSALQAEEDPAAARAGAPRVAADLRLSEDDVTATLLDTRRAVLGLVKGLRRPSGCNRRTTLRCNGHPPPSWRCVDGTGRRRDGPSAVVLAAIAVGVG